MKLHQTFWIVLTELLVTHSLLAQSQFAVRNGYIVDAPVFDAQGNRLAGPTYLAELWGGASSNALSPVVNIDQGFRREIVPFLSDGYFSSSAAFMCVMDVPPYGSAWLQVRAWDANLGSTYEQVQGLGIGGYGESPLFYAQGSDPFVLELPAPLIGLQSFSLREIVPEPNSAALLLLGVAFLFRRRRSQ